MEADTLQLSIRHVRRLQKRTATDRRNTSAIDHRALWYKREPMTHLSSTQTKGSDPARNQGPGAVSGEYEHYEMTPQARSSGEDPSHRYDVKF